jgi:hypothetical protein
MVLYKEKSKADFDLIIFKVAILFKDLQDSTNDDDSSTNITAATTTTG